MNKYPAIWQAKLDVNSKSLLKEFNTAYPQDLNKVYSKNDNWKGVTVFKAGERCLLNNLPEVSQIVQRLGLNNVVGITYFNLEKNSNLHQHRDMNGNLLFGILRIHIPLKTNEKAFMTVENIDYQLPTDSAWVLDTSGLHGLKNGSIDNRIHLVVDIKKGPETAAYFPNWSIPLAFHLSKFIFIMFSKILRDVILNPISVIKRIKEKMGGGNK